MAAAATTQWWLPPRADEAAVDVEAGVFLLPGLPGAPGPANSRRIGKAGFSVGRCGVMAIESRTSHRDGQALLESIRKGAFAADAGIAPGDPDGIGALAQTLSDWFDRQYSQPPNKGDSAWDSRRLTPALQAAASRSDAAELLLLPESL